MKKAKVEKRYFKIAKKAASFNDPVSGLNIRGKEIVSIASVKIIPTNKTIEKALAAGHLIELKLRDIPEGTPITKLPITIIEKKALSKTKTQVQDEEDDHEEVLEKK